MADAGVTLAERATEFFAAIDSAPRAGEKIAAFPVELMITTPRERVTVQFEDGRPGAARAAAADAEPGYWTLEIRGEREVFDAIFDGTLTLGEAMFAALLFLPEEKSKHNLAAAVGQTVRLTQDLHRRANDPRNQRS